MICSLRDDQYDAFMKHYKPRCRVYDPITVLKEFAPLKTNDLIDGKLVEPLNKDCRLIYGTQDHVFKFKVADDQEYCQEVLVGIILTQAQIPNVVRTHGHIVDFPAMDDVEFEDPECIVMDRLHGPDISDFMRYHATDHLVTHAVIMDFLKGYQQAHDKVGFTHYDLHTGNVIVQDNVALMIDFGMARVKWRDGSIGHRDELGVGIYDDRSNWIYDMFKFFAHLWEDTMPQCMWSGQINRIMHTLRCFLLYEDKLVPVTNDLEELYQLVMAGNHPRKDKTTVIMEQYRANIKFAMSAGLPLQKFFFHALTFFDPAMTIDTLKILWQGNSYWRTHAYSTEGTESESLAAFIKHVGDFKF